jgi:hypothetical protein
VALLFFCCERPYCTDPYSPYGFGMKIKAVLGTFFEVDCFLFPGCMEQSVQQTVGIVFEELTFLGNRGRI